MQTGAYYSGPMAWGSVSCLCHSISPLFSLSGCEFRQLRRRHAEPPKFPLLRSARCPKHKTTGIAPGRSNLQPYAGCFYLVFAAAGAAVDKTSVFSRAFKRLLYRENRVRMQHTLLHALVEQRNGGAILRLCGLFVTLDQSLAQKAQAATTPRVRLARFTSVRVTV